MATTVELFKLEFEDGADIKLYWKDGAAEYITIIQMDENGNLTSIVDSFATVANVFFATRVSAAVNAMK